MITHTHLVSPRLNDISPALNTEKRSLSLNPWDFVMMDVAELPFAPARRAHGGPTLIYSRRGLGWVGSRERKLCGAFTVLVLVGSL